MGASCAALLNAIKLSAGIDDRVNLISPMVLAPIQHLKIEHLGNSNPRLHTDEVLIALSISAVTNPTAELAMEALASLRGSQVHSSVILSSVDEGDVQAPRHERYVRAGLSVAHALSQVRNRRYGTFPQ